MSALIQNGSKCPSRHAQTLLLRRLDYDYENVLCLMQRNPKFLARCLSWRFGDENLIILMRHAMEMESNEPTSVFPSLPSSKVTSPSHPRNDRHDCRMSVIGRFQPESSSLEEIIPRKAAEVGTTLPATKSSVARRTLRFVDVKALTKNVIAIWKQREGGDKDWRQSRSIKLTSSTTFDRITAQDLISGPIKSERKGVIAPTSMLRRFEHFNKTRIRSKRYRRHDCRKSTRQAMKRDDIMEE